LLLRVSLIVFMTTAFSIIFQATTFALPKIFDERLQGLASAGRRWLQSHGLGGKADVATMVGALRLRGVRDRLDGAARRRQPARQVGARPVFMGAARSSSCSSA
jgi:hypothetical protein